MVEPTGYTAIGMIGFTDKGPYDPLAVYVKNDLVHHNNCIWKVLVDDLTGVTPVEGINYTMFIDASVDEVIKNLAPTEENPAQSSHSMGDQFINLSNDTLYKATKAISVNDALIDVAIDPTNGNMEKAPRITEQIASLNDSLSNKMKRNAIYIGNSFTAGDGSTGGNNGIFARTKDLLFDNAYMYTDGARGLVNYQSFTTNFLTLLQGAISSGDFDVNDITDVIFVGAYGDVRAYDSGVTESAFLTQCIDIRTLIDSTFPNIKKVSYINAHAQYSFNAQGYLACSSSPFKVHKMLSRVLAKSNIDYLGWIGWNLMYNTAQFSTDNIHPNDNGYAWLAGEFINVYQGGELIYIPYVRETSIEFHGHVCESNYNLNPDELIVSVGRIDRRVNGVNTPITLTQNNQYVFNLSDPIMYFNPIFSRSGQMSIKVGDHAGTEGIADINFIDATTFPKLGFLWKTATTTFPGDIYCFGLQLIAPW